MSVWLRFPIKWFIVNNFPFAFAYCIIMLNNFLFVLFSFSRDAMRFAAFCIISKNFLVIILNSGLIFQTNHLG